MSMDIEEKSEAEFLGGSSACSFDVAVKFPPGLLCMFASLCRLFDRPVRIEFFPVQMIDDHVREFSGSPAQFSHHRKRQRLAARIASDHAVGSIRNFLRLEPSIMSGYKNDRQ